MLFHVSGIRAILSVTVLLVFSCRGMAYNEELLSRRYNEIAQIKTHNATSTTKDKLMYVLPNFVADQHKNVAEQLADGIRVFKLPIHLNNDTPWIAHTLPLDEFNGYLEKYVKIGFLRNLLLTYIGAKLWKIDASNQSLESFFIQMKQYLDNNPQEVVTLSFAIHFPITKFDKLLSLLKSTGIYNYLHFQDTEKPWPTLAEMIHSNKRLVIFTNKYSFSNFDMQNNDWACGVLFEDDFIIQNNWGFTSIDELNVDLAQEAYPVNTKPLPISRLAELNHTVTPGLAGDPKIAHTINNYPVLKAHLDRYNNALHLYPNFINVDFYDENFGSLQTVVNEINQNLVRNADDTHEAA